MFITKDDILTEEEINERSIIAFKNWSETMIGNFSNSARLLKVHDKCVKQIINDFKSNNTSHFSSVERNKEAMVDMYLKNKVLFPRRDELLKK